ncbi:hypothetical protein RAS1_28110 [Phycisphaerae bacterium RAS1]|nr:hypothetical protein RAS1_28110 [Phycisphaerae bacterium RAS1]
MHSLQPPRGGGHAVPTNHPLLKLAGCDAPLYGRFYALTDSTGPLDDPAVAECDEGERLEKFRQVRGAIAAKLRSWLEMRDLLPPI